MSLVIAVARLMHGFTLVSSDRCAHDRIAVDLQAHASLCKL